MNEFVYLFICLRRLILGIFACVKVPYVNRSKQILKKNVHVRDQKPKVISEKASFSASKYERVLLTMFNYEKL